MIHRSFPVWNELSPTSVQVYWQYLTLEDAPLERSTLAEGLEALQSEGIFHDASLSGLKVRAILEIPKEAIVGQVVAVGGRVRAVLEWLSHDSLQRGLGEVQELDLADDPAGACCELELASGVLRKQVRFRVLLVLDDPAIPGPSMASLPGTILGTVESPAILLENRSGLFPVRETLDPSGPPWWVEIGVVDPLEDLFDEGSFHVVLNRHWHDLHEELVRSGDSFSPRQALAWSAAIQMLMTRVAADREAWKVITGVGKGTIHPGSVAELVKLWRERHGWTDDPLMAPDSLQRRIHADLLERTRSA